MERAKHFLRTTQDAEGLRAAQATLLPLLGFSLDQTAEIVGRNRFWVSRARNLFLRGELPPLPRRGGRRHCLVPEEMEVKLVKLALANVDGPWDPESLRSRLRKVLQEHSESDVSDSAVTEILNRAAPKIILGAKGTHLTRIDFYLGRVFQLERILAKENNIEWP